MRITERDNGRQSAFVKTQVSKGFFSLHLKTHLALQYAYSEGGSCRCPPSQVTGHTPLLCRQRLRSRHLSVPSIIQDNLLLTV